MTDPKNTMFTCICLKHLVHDHSPNWFVMATIGNVVLDSLNIANIQRLVSKVFNQVCTNDKTYTDVAIDNNILTSPKGSVLWFLRRWTLVHVMRNYITILYLFTSQTWNTMQNQELSNRIKLKAMPSLGSTSKVHHCNNSTIFNILFIEKSFTISK